MSMSVTVTASAEEIKIISNTLDCLEFVSNMLSQKTALSLSNSELSYSDIAEAKNYFSSLLMILNTKGMSLQDYEESLKSNN